jgi:hypothetical protein
MVSRSARAPFGFLARLGVALLMGSAAFLVATGAAAQDEDPPPVLPSAPAQGPRAPGGQATYDESTFVTVTIGADAPNVYLEALTVHDRVLYFRHDAALYGRFDKVGRWHRVCAAPCTIRVPPNLRYRVAGPSVPMSDEFAIGPPSSERTLRVNTGSKGGQAAGIVMLVVGIPAAIVGVIIAAAAGGSDGRTAGFLTVGGGAGLIAGGAVLLATNGTNVYDAEGRHVGRARPVVRGVSLGAGTWLTPGGIVF